MTLRSRLARGGYEALGAEAIGALGFVAVAMSEAKTGNVARGTKGL